MQSVKQQDINYFLVFRMTPPGIEPPIWRTIGEYSTHQTNAPV